MAKSNVTSIRKEAAPSAAHPPLPPFSSGRKSDLLVAIDEVRAVVKMCSGILFDDFPNEGSDLTMEVVNALDLAVKGLSTLRNEIDGTEEAQS